MEDERITLRDYTEAFKVKKALRRVGKANVPLKEGLFVDDIKVFGVTLVVWLLTYTMVLAPPIRAAAAFLGTSPPVGLPYFLILFTPPLVAAMASRRPVRHNLGIFGLVRALWRDLLDDPVHRRGVPVRKGHGAPRHHVTVWRAHPDVLPKLASRLPLPNGYSAGTAPVRTPEETHARARPERPAAPPTGPAAAPGPPDHRAPAEDFLITARRA
ncbi:hypothetical protein [Streptomyces sp. GSL17-111]|uniref:hypothetical protein n=1 Tax=Streptomyces sp. GSL17-111 TaxID=3121596 RepID=UPI0030F376F4